MKFGGLPADAGLPAQGGEAYDFSWRWGVESDPGHQGYHGLKAEVHDDFLTVGKAVKGAQFLPTIIKYENDGRTYYSTAVIAPADMTAYALTGGIKPGSVVLNGEAADGGELKLKAGANSLVLSYDKPGRTYFVVSKSPGDEPKNAGPEDPQAQPIFHQSPLAMKWWNNPDVLPFDVRAAEPNPVGWYRFTAPPGLRSTTWLPINSLGKNTQEWWLTPLVSLKGMPSKLNTILLSDKPRIVILASPRPTPLGELENMPGTILSAWV